MYNTAIVLIEVEIPRGNVTCALEEEVEQRSEVDLFTFREEDEDHVVDSEEVGENNRIPIEVSACKKRGDARTVIKEEPVVAETDGAIEDNGAKELKENRREREADT